MAQGEPSICCNTRSKAKIQQQQNYADFGILNDKMVQFVGEMPKKKLCVLQKKGSWEGYTFFF